MDQTIRMTPEPQRLQALARANKVRLARAELKRRIADGGVSAADIILGCPEAAENWSVGELLMSQRRWGINRCRKFLARNQISEIKQIGTLTQRQRDLLATQLKSCEQLATRLEHQNRSELDHVGPTSPLQLEHTSELELAFA
jgi:hypothetical protein